MAVESVVGLRVWWLWVWVCGYGGCRFGFIGVGCGGPILAVGLWWLWVVDFASGGYGLWILWWWPI